MDHMKTAMASVLEGMGRAAREGRARRYTKRPAKGVDVTMGEVELKPTPPNYGGLADVEVDPVKTADLSDNDMDDLASELQVER